MSDLKNGSKGATNRDSNKKTSRNSNRNSSRASDKIAKEITSKDLEILEARFKRQERFLDRNDKRLKSLRDLDEAVLQKSRDLQNQRLKERREKIEKTFVGDDEAKKAKFDEMTKRTDKVVERSRQRQDARIKKHRKRVDRQRKKYVKKVDKYFTERRIVLENRFKLEKSEFGKRLIRRNKISFVFGILGLILVFILIQLLIPTSAFRRNLAEEENTATETDAVAETVEVLDETLKPKMDHSGGPTEQQRLWQLLLDHFDGNETAALGVMCNLWSESKFEAVNLEDYNNEIWSVDDITYTTDINQGAITRKDFLEARTYNMTNGYYNDYSEWVNVDGGYGYAQYTAYTKKEKLYQFAEQWFGPGGEGENYRFDIGDPDMQAHYVISLLESDEFATLDSRIRNAGSVVDACYYWLRFYEVPYDPYCDNYYTLAFDRAECASRIKEECDVNFDKYEEGNSTEGGAGEGTSEKTGGESDDSKEGED